MDSDPQLIDAAIGLIRARYPDDDDFKGAAALRTKSGRILTSTAPLMPLAATDFCHETGAMCEAHKLNEDVTASVCVSRIQGKYHILAPCGICQERLYLWGPEVKVAVPLLEDTTQWQMKTLSEVHPYYWKNGYP